MNKSRKMNIIIVNAAYFLGMPLFYFTVQSDIMLIAISNATVTVVF